MERRLDATLGAVKTMQPALAKFYGSLGDEQKAPFNPPASPREDWLAFPPWRARIRAGDRPSHLASRANHLAGRSGDGNPNSFSKLEIGCFS
jgi:hypothetical protein